jgi:hypothetical protein
MTNTDQPKATRVLEQTVSRHPRGRLHRDSTAVDDDGHPAVATTTIEAAA